MHRVSEIKLIRTDTTLDLSQKAEKVWETSINFHAQATVVHGKSDDAGPLKRLHTMYEFNCFKIKKNVM